MFLNLIGALTAKPYAFTIRPWELQNIETIDIFDSLCSNIRIDFKNSNIIRILPINNEFINNEWISDKTRFGYDSLKRWRFIYPMFKNNNIFYQTSWNVLFKILKKKIKINNFDSIVVKTGPFADIETLFAVQNLSDKNNKIILNNEVNINSDLTNYFLSLKKLKENKIYLFLGNNLRIENPLLNIQLKKLSKIKLILIGYIGVKYESNFNMFHLGTNLKIFKNIIEGKHFFIKKINKEFNNRNIFKKKIWIILGRDFFNRINSKQTILFLENFINDNFFYTLLPTSTGKLNLLTLGAQNFKILNKNKTNLYYIIGSENIKNFNYNDFIIFQGHHNDKIRKWFDLILPTATWVEKSSLYFNCFGFLQKSNFVFLYPYKTRLDWKIINMIHIFLNSNISNFSIYTRLNEIIPKYKKYIANYNLFLKYEIRYVKKYCNNFYVLDEYPFTNYYPFYCYITSVERSSKILTAVISRLEKEQSNFC